MQLVTFWFGTFLMDGKNIVDKRLFPKEPKLLSRYLKNIEDGDVLKEEEELAFLAHSDTPLGVIEERLSDLGLKVDMDIDILPEEFGYEDSMLREAMIHLGQEEMSTVHKDVHLIHAVNAMDDLVKTLNLLSERFLEWSIAVMPEIEREMTVDDVVQRIETSQDLSGAFQGKMDEDDSTVVMGFIDLMTKISGQRKELEQYLRAQMEEVAPNISTLTGPVLGARLISLAGGLERLARMPSSTVQVLGAEKALFKHIKDGIPPPKHGVIFQHTLVHNAPYWQRGKIARAFAGKISIAARVDATTGRDVSSDLNADLVKKVESIHKKFPDPPKGKTRKRR